MPNITMQRDMVLISPTPLRLNKTADGIILPGDLDKMAPKRATVIAAGPGKYVKEKFIPNTVKTGDQILYMERNLIPVKLEGEDYIILHHQDIILKLGHEEFENETLKELTDAEYRVETMRRLVIQKMKAANLVRVQDMLNPTENFIGSDGETIVVKSRAFLLDEDSLNEPFVPPEGTVAFSMMKLNYLKLSDQTVKVVINVGFLPRSDVTLG